MAKKKAIILSTHNLEEMDAVCTRALIISNGKIVADDTPLKLKARSSVHGAVCFKVPTGGGEEVQQELERLPDVERVEVLSEGEADMTVRVYPKDPSLPPADKIIRYFQERGCDHESQY